MSKVMVCPVFYKLKSNDVFTAVHKEPNRVSPK